MTADLEVGATRIRIGPKKPIGPVLFLLNFR
jgi:hypothetical protein